MGNSGGIPVNADLSQITDPGNKALIARLQHAELQERPGLLPGLARARLLRRDARLDPGPDERQEHVQRPERAGEAVQRQPRQHRQGLARSGRGGGRPARCASATRRRRLP